MKLELTFHEACLLREYLDKSIVLLEQERARTGKLDAQRALQRQIDALHAIELRVEHLAGDHRLGSVA